ncbi:MAG: hypothetical protein KIT81_14585 [Alphaproteobacteria bacterium]|nr:hypothetical protein [Alphaproteobacteria bacterium]
MIVERLLSFTLALVALALVWRLPALRAEAAGLPLRAILALLLAGSILALVHAFGLQPSGGLLRRACRPIVAWPLCGGAIALALANAYLS